MVSMMVVLEAILSIAIKLVTVQERLLLKG